MPQFPTLFLGKFKTNPKSWHDVKSDGEGQCRRCHDDMFNRHTENYLPRSADVDTWKQMIGH